MSLIHVPPPPSLDLIFQTAEVGKLPRIAADIDEIELSNLKTTSRTMLAFELIFLISPLQGSGDLALIYALSDDFPFHNAISLAGCLWGLNIHGSCIVPPQPDAWFIRVDSTL